MSTQPTESSAPRLEDIALKAHHDKVQKDKEEHIRASREYVRSLVGDEMFEQCVYTDNDRWLIGGVEFRCFTKERCCCPGPAPSLGYTSESDFNVFYERVASLADIGKILARKRNEANMRSNASAPTIPDRTGLLGWFRNLRKEPRE
jgi:hypothetical protein